MHNENYHRCNLLQYPILQPNGVSIANASFVGNIDVIGSLNGIFGYVIKETLKIVSATLYGMLGILGLR